MRMFVVAAAVALLGACDAGPEKKKPPTELEEKNGKEARAAFEKWMEVTLKGDIDAHYDLLSHGFVSQWIFKLLMLEDRDAHEWRASLAGTRARTGLDLWWEYSRKKYSLDERPQPLPWDVYADPTAKAFYKKVFEHQRVQVQEYVSKITIHSVAADAGAVTILVKNSRGEFEGYAMVFDRGTWRMDGYHSRARGAGSPR